MVKIIHILTATLTSTTPVPVDDPNYTIVYLLPPPDSGFVIEQLPSFQFAPNAPLGVAYDSVSLQIMVSGSPLAISLSDDLNCPDILDRNIPIVGADPNNLDGDNDGIGCEE